MVGMVCVVRFSESAMAKEIPDADLAGLTSGIPGDVVGSGYSSGCSSSSSLSSSSSFSSDLVISFSDKPLD